MPESKCYICGKSGQFEKLFRNCKHDSACSECLRCRYVHEAQNDEPEKNLGALYPLQCFHPECNLLLRDTQMKRLIRSDHELQNFHRLSIEANVKKQTKKRAMIQKVHDDKQAEIRRVRFGWMEGDWEALADALVDEQEVCQCPKCKMLIIKSDGCWHITCFCGADFDWSDASIRISRSCYKIEDKYDEVAQFYADSMKVSIRRSPPNTKQKRRAPTLRMEDDSDIYTCDDFSMPEESPDEVETVREYCSQSFDLVNCDFDIVPSDFDSSFPSLCLAETCAVAKSTTYECNSEDFEVLELDSNSSDDSWSQLESDVDCQSTTRSQGAQWEEVSEVSSVVSFDSKTGMSFLQAARAKASNKSTSNSSWKEVSQVPIPMSKPLYTIAEVPKPMAPRDCNIIPDVLFNADFMYDGVKRSRGGKQKFRTKVVS